MWQPANSQPNKHTQHTQHTAAWPEISGRKRQSGWWLLVQLAIRTSDSGSCGTFTALPRPAGHVTFLTTLLQLPLSEGCCVRCPAHFIRARQTPPTFNHNLHFNHTSSVALPDEWNSVHLTLNTAPSLVLCPRRNLS